MLCLIRFEVYAQSSRMNAPIPENLLVTLIRHQFYTKVDWERIRAAADRLRDRELRAVITHLIAVDAPELPAEVKVRIEEELIAEVSQFGVERISVYLKRLNPPSTLWQSTSQWLLTPVLALLHRSNRRAELRQLADNPQAG